MQNKTSTILKTMRKTLKNSFKPIVGWTGASIIVFTYLLLTMGVFKADTVIFNIFQLSGGILLAIRVWLDRNYSNFMLEVFFISIALYAIFKTWNMN